MGGSGAHTSTPHTLSVNVHAQLWRFESLFLPSETHMVPRAGEELEGVDGDDLGCAHVVQDARRTDGDARDHLLVLLLTHLLLFLSLRLIVADTATTTTTIGVGIFG